MPIELKGKVAVVTGASRGIGRAAALQLAAAGAHVVADYHKSAEDAESLMKEIAARRGKAELFQADVSDPDQVCALFDRVRERAGRLDILVNNAGIVRDRLVLSTELSDWDRVLAVNLRGAFLCTRHAAQMMMLNHSGTIVNVASTAAIRGGRGQANYAASKGGLVALTRACAAEFAGKGIRVNAVLPGMIETAMTERVRRRAGQEILGRIPCGRFGEPSDVAAVILFLASSMSGYITGQAIAVDGGMSIA
jgi:3-oxoacyl-[acyl-carrier protein] reductase